ncbi:MAG: transcriptional regulator CynR [Pseudomonadota bacterium]|jgi:LysR family cyn operon transcriptional activator
MELRHLRYFVAIADAGTMGRAAEQVFVTQSTLSHQLAQLEDVLGVALFERIGRTLRLTEAGRELLGHARGVLAQVEEGCRAVSRTRTTASGSLRVGVIHSFVTSLMPRVAAAFLGAHPGVRLQIAELTGVDIETQVADGRLDLGVAFYPPMCDGVMGERLFDDTLVLAVPADHALASNKRVRFAQLGDLPLAMLSSRFATRRLLDGHFQRAGVRPNVVVEIDSVDALHRLVEQGAAAAFLPRRSTRRTARVCLVEVTDPQPVRAAGLVWRRSPYRSAAALAFVDVLTAVLATEVS